MTPEDQRYFDKNFKEVREEIQKVNRALGIIISRLPPVFDDNKK